MRYILSSLCAGALALAISGPVAASPAGLAQAPATAPAGMGAPVINVQAQDFTGPSSGSNPYIRGQNGRIYRDRGDSRRWQGDRRVRPDRGHRDGGNFYRRGGYAYYHGHRGYPRYRRGYRHYNGFWFPPAAFLGGAIIGSAIASGQATESAHVRWCYDRYRSYRASDNTYQPYNGPRRQCTSPYNRY